MSSLLAGLRTTSAEKRTSSAVNGTPSDHFASRRRWYVIVLPSAAMPPFARDGTAVASSGTGRFCSSYRTSHAIVSEPM